jgi:hypothetical protein
MRRDIGGMPQPDARCDVRGQHLQHVLGREARQIVVDRNGTHVHGLRTGSIVGGDARWRKSLSAAASKADGNLAAVRSIERTLIAAAQAQRCGP